MEPKLVCALSEAQGFVTSVAFDASSSSSPSSSNNSNTEIWTLTASEDDFLRLYNLEQPQPPPIVHANPQQQKARLGQIPLSFLAAQYHLPNTGAHKSVFTQGNVHCLVAPRLRKDQQVYCLNLETGQFVASYQCTATARVQQPDEQQPWFSTLNVHPTARGVFAAGGEGSAVHLYSASVASPIGRLGAGSSGRPIVEFSPNGNSVAYGDRESVLLFDWRKIGGTTTAQACVAQYKVKDVVQASRWLTDPGAVSGLHFFPVASSSSSSSAAADASGESSSSGSHHNLLVTTSRYVVRTLNTLTGSVVHSFGASGAAASHLPNEKPLALSSKRVVPTAARFSPDGRFVAVGTCMGRVALFETPGMNNSKEVADSSNSSSSSSVVAAAQAVADDASVEHRAAALTHVLYGQHQGAVSCAEWCPSVPVLMSTCRIGNVWRFASH